MGSEPCRSPKPEPFPAKPHARPPSREPCRRWMPRPARPWNAVSAAMSASRCANRRVIDLRFPPDCNDASLKRRHDFGGVSRRDGKPHRSLDAQRPWLWAATAAGPMLIASPARQRCRRSQRERGTRQWPRRCCGGSSTIQRRTSYTEVRAVPSETRSRRAHPRNRVRLLLCLPLVLDSGR